MKFLTALNSYIRDSVLPMIILAIMLTFSILLLVTTVAQVGYIMYDYDVVASAELDNAYYISNVMSAEEFNEWYITPYDEVSEKFETMRSDPSVESVFTVRSITSSFYGNRQLSIVIFEREMLDYFPELKKSGLNFTDDPYGCILATPELNSYKEGDTLEMSLSGAGSATQALNVLGHVSYPYHGMTFSSGGNNIDVSSLFSESGGVFMLYSDELMATLMERNAEIKYNPGYMVVFKDAPNLDLIFTSDEQAIPFLLRDVVETSKTLIREILTDTLPRPLFLLASAFIAYVSTTVLMFKKKEGELAVNYLCGCSRTKCGLIAFCAYNLISIVPVIINIIVVTIAPELHWQGTVNLSGYKFDSQTILYIFGCYAVTALIAVIVTVGSMAKHTPITYLRGARE